MVITIRSVETRPDGPRVEFDSPWGPIHGRWMGPAPAVGSSDLVELDISETLKWGKNIRSIAAAPLRVSCSEGHLSIEGPCDDVHDDGSVVMRLGKSLLMIETTGRIPLAVSHVWLESPGFSIFPITAIAESGV